MYGKPISEIASPYNNKVLRHLRNRRFNENPMQNGLDLEGNRTVWYRVSLKGKDDMTDLAQEVMTAVEACFRKEGLEPKCNRRMDSKDSRVLLEFTFSPEVAEQVNAAVENINAASRRHEEQPVSALVAK